MAAGLVTYQMPALPGAARWALMADGEGRVGAERGEESAAGSDGPLASFLACLVGFLTGTLGLGPSRRHRNSPGCPGREGRAMGSQPRSLPPACTGARLGVGEGGDLLEVTQGLR